jgi:hypothetical protein
MRARAIMKTIIGVLGEMENQGRRDGCAHPDYKITSRALLE